MINDSEKDGILPYRFKSGKRSPKHPAVSDRGKDGTVIQISLIVILSVLTGLTFTFQKRENRHYVYIPPDVALNVQQIPETKVGRNLPPPPPRMPAVPVESEMEDYLDEVEFEIETLDYVELPNLPDAPGYAGGVGRSPRPLYDRFPEYPDSERKKGYKGIIDVNVFIDEKGRVTNVDVVRNTTNSKVLEQTAVEAAYKTIYQPALDNKNKPIASWTVRTYTFGIEK